jgi:hypothetical protein
MEFRVHPAGLGSLKRGTEFGDEIWQDATVESFVCWRCCGNVCPQKETAAEDGASPLLRAGNV